MCCFCPSPLQDHAAALKSLKSSHAQELDALNAAARATEASLRQSAADAAAGAAEQHAVLSAALADLQEQWQQRPSRPEDVARIEALEQAVRERDEALRTSEERMAQLRSEMLLREENYNKHFRNGGLGEKVLDVGAAMGSQQGVVDWMLKAKSRRSTGGGDSFRKPA